MENKHKDFIESIKGEEISLEGTFSKNKYHIHFHWKNDMHMQIKQFDDLETLVSFIRENQDRICVIEAHE